MIKVTPKGDGRQAEISIRRSLSKFRGGIREGLFEIGAENVRHLRNLLKDRVSKTGRWYLYKRHASHGGGFWYQASAAGQAPAKRSSLLMRTTHYKVRGSREVEFGDKQPYGKVLEFGGVAQLPSGAKVIIKPRPHVSRTAKEQLKNNFNSITHSVRKRLKRK